MLGEKNGCCNKKGGEWDRMKYIIDAGSKSLKIYYIKDGKIEEKEKKSYRLIDSYLLNAHEYVLGEKDSLMLIELFVQLKEKYGLTKSNTRIFATGHFRYFTNVEYFIDCLYCQTELHFVVISQDLEAFYQDVKFLPYSKHIGRTMVISIGGGSIQISFYEYGKESRRALKLPWGTNYISTEAFPSINSDNNKKILYDIVNKIDSEFGKEEMDYPVAIFIGGELDFMTKAKYPLTINTLLEDSDHPSMISTTDYCRYNESLFEDFTCEQLMGLMPQNPEWMLGARPYSAVAQTICMHFGVKYIIPSDCNIVHGIVQQEYRNVVICGSFRQKLPQIASLIKEMRENGINVISPKSITVTDKDGDYVLFEGDKKEKHCKLMIEKYKHLKAIKQEDCDAVLICNFDDYIGKYTAGEIFIASEYNKKMVFLEEGENEQDFDLPHSTGLYIN